MKQMMLIVLSAMNILFGSLSVANEGNYTGSIIFKEDQLENLKYAYDMGVRSDKISHEDSGYIFSALAWQESSAGRITSGGKGHKAYGLFQNYLPTVRNRLKQLGLVYTDQNIINMLNDRHFSAIFAEIELSYWLEWHGGDMFRALASYNAGYKWTKSKGYAKEVMRKANHLKKHDNGFLNDQNYMGDSDDLATTS